MKIPSRYRRLLEALAENATLALFIIDEHQRCTFVNAAAERLTGFSLAEPRSAGTRSRASGARGLRLGSPGTGPHARPQSHGA